MSAFDSSRRTLVGGAVAAAALAGPAASARRKRRPPEGVALASLSASALDWDAGTFSLTYRVTALRCVEGASECNSFDNDVVVTVQARIDGKHATEAQVRSQILDQLNERLARSVGDGIEVVLL